MRQPTFVTEHAVDRYLERWRSKASRGDARAELEDQIKRAVFVEHPAGEEAIWRTPRGALLVVRADGAVATVLPQGAVRTNRRPRK